MRPPCRAEPMLGTLENIVVFSAKPCGRCGIETVSRNLFCRLNGKDCIFSLVSTWRRGESLDFMRAEFKMDCYLFRHHPFTAANKGINAMRLAFGSTVQMEHHYELNVPEGTLLFGSEDRIAEGKDPLSPYHDKGCKFEENNRGA